MGLYTLDPLDTYFVRDGRGFEAGSDTDAASLPVPTPFTLNGMVRGALLGSDACRRWRFYTSECSGCDRLHGCAVRPAVGSRLGVAGGLAGTLSVSGPWFVVNEQVLLPAPLDMIVEEDALSGAMSGDETRALDTHVLAPAEGDARASLPTGMRMLQPSVELRGFHPVPGWISWPVFADYAKGLRPKLRRLENWWTAADLLVVEPRVGLAMDNKTGRALDAHLYFAQHRRLQSGVRLALEIDITGDASKLLDGIRVVPLGGEMRAATFGVQEFAAPWEATVDLDTAETAAPAPTRVKWVLLQPAWFAAGWHPVISKGWKLVAARLERTERIGGWNAALGDPRPLLSFVPAGAVYYLERVPDVADEDAERAYVAASRADTPSMTAEPVAFSDMGFGFSLPATW